jgi:hypothetical protein
MHSFHQSRGRILFEVFCALTISASVVGAWIQTGAWALLPAAVASLLYGLIHAFDLTGRSSAVTIEPQRIDFTTDHQDDLPACQDDGVPLAMANQQLESDHAIDDAEPAEPITPRASKSRRAKAPRKGGARGASAPVEEKVTEPECPDEAKMPVPEPHEEAAHHSLAPLFEPEPFARQRHAVFGRKAG